VLKDKEKEFRQLLSRGVLPETLGETMRTVARDRSVAVELRAFAVDLFKEVAARAWFELPAFFAGDDPLVPHLRSFLDELVTDEDRSPEERKALLEAALRSPWPAVRAHAAERVPGSGLLPPSDAVALLTGLVADPEESVRGPALRGLCIAATEEPALRTDVVATLSRTIRDRDGAMPVSDYDRLIESWTREERAALAEAALESPHEAWHVYALKHGTFIGALDNPPETIERLIDDPRPPVRKAAMEALVNSSDVRAAPLIVRLLEDPGMTPWLHPMIAALERLAVAESVEALLRLTENKNVAIRESAAFALKTIRNRLEQQKQWTSLLESIRSSRPAPDVKKP
jgi:HEAT repeat protein